MKITFLGTGTSQGIPIIGSKHPVCLSQNSKDKRLRVSVMIEWDDYRYIVDCGPDFRQQMLRHDVDRIDGILFTHEHNDHVIGLDDIRPFYFRQSDISVYAEDRVIGELKKRFEYVFQEENKYPGAPTLDVNLVDIESFKLKNMQVQPIRVYHNKLPVFGYRMNDFAYVTDAKTIPDSEMEKLKGLKVLVLNALRLKPHHSHFNLEEALEIISILKPEKAYLTHISHLLGFHDDVEAELPDNVHLAYDNLQIQI
ncbi:MBL fold metallo-hydrolase [Psychroflexus halocasei]|uniref:Phosphoribosyl 1,2-cyclic phosphate phosphodiesterase n=1 Tax=Psychroflexus halocasei TaxID=908615 RepID=A0A1H3X9G5_9FLAO|nr:MBL fold metallo-hydrolase [Psychroflexus halocasei]SDZ95262.1 phosphoribosyl 1,2-cyclic phosphate phosphodiesterase [Psychroflexus halocasei]